ncbi:hypothetical protein AGMMS50262_06650 [Bacteroidia bacterium]|nr:hypothetical protein AGMMS50262_06650 [Bacteroidia bacterium]
MGSKKKKLTRVGLVVIIVAAAVALTGFFLARNAENILKERITQNVSQMTDGLYHLTFRKLDLNILTGFLNIDDINLQLNEERLNELSQKDSIPRLYGTVKIKNVHFEGVDFVYKRKRKKRELNFHRLEIIRPQIALIHPVSVRKDTVKQLPNNTFYEMIEPYLDVFSISEIRLENGELNFSSENETDTTTLQIQNINFRADKFRIDSLADKKSPCFLYSEDYRLTVDSSKVHFPNHLYTIRTGKIEWQLKDSLFRAKNIAYQTLVPKAQFIRNHADWFDVEVGAVELKNLHIQKIETEKSVQIDSIFVSDVYFNNYKNGKIPVVHRIVPMIYEPFQKFPIPYAIDYLKASNVNVAYEELAKDRTQAGFINFTQMEGIFDKGLTNIVREHTQTNRLLAKAKLMNAGLIRAELYFPVDSTYDYAVVKGSLGTMNMLSLNKIITPMTSASINSGFIQRMDFDIRGGKKSAKINMCLRYNDLTVDIGSWSLFANGLIRNNNPKNPNDPLQCVEVTHIRDPYHSSFNYLWKICFDGLSETLGYTQVRKKRVEWIQKEIKEIKKLKKKL